MSRFAGNQAEHAPVFLPCMWTYAAFCDYETAGALGILYCITRVVYPLFYCIHGRFTFWFEHITQTGYAVNGTFFLGLLMRGLKEDYLTFAKDNQILAPILGAALGVFTLLPGVGVTVPWFTVATYCDRRRKRAEALSK